MCKSKTQTITATSSTEAEFIAAVDAAKSARYLRSVLKELDFEQVGPTPIFEDNEATIKIVNHDAPTERTRHMDIRFFALQDWKREGSVILKKISGTLEVADAWTKPLGWILHHRHCRRAMGHFPLAGVDASKKDQFG